MKAKKWYIVVLLCLVIGCMALIFRFSSQVAAQSNIVSTHVTEQIVKAVMPQYPALTAAEQKKVVKKANQYIRKAAHFSIYMLLGIFLFLLFSCKKGWKKRAKWYSIVVGLFYAISDEWHQRFVPGRGPEIRDVCIDVSGVILGVMISSLILYLILKNYEKKKGVDSNADPS